MNELQEAIMVLDETLQGDLERCDKALAAGDLGMARGELQSAMAKLSGLTDLLRNASPNWD